MTCFNSPITLILIAICTQNTQSSTLPISNLWKMQCSFYFCYVSWSLYWSFIEAPVTGNNEKLFVEFWLKIEVKFFEFRQIRQARRNGPLRYIIPHPDDLPPPYSNYGPTVSNDGQREGNGGVGRVAIGKSNQFLSYFSISYFFWDL